MTIVRGLGRSQWTTVKVMVDVQDEKAQSAESTPWVVPPSGCLETSQCAYNLQGERGYCCRCFIFVRGGSIKKLARMYSLNGGKGILW